MNIYDKNQDFFNLPIRLTKKQQKEPVTVFKDFFADHNLFEIRRRLANWLECALTTDSNHFEEPKQRANVTILATRLEELLAAASLGPHCYLDATSLLPRAPRSNRGGTEKKMSFVPGSPRPVPGFGGHRPHICAYRQALIVLLF